MCVYVGVGVGVRVWCVCVSLCIGGGGARVLRRGIQNYGVCLLRLAHWLVWGLGAARQVSTVYRTASVAAAQD